ncbi:hypothetical protein [Duganella sp. HH105]|uniref:hypothetical protein n=1 Tax=Duganella sp. HH105 TaxID=1781067 RepID=UPI00114D0BB1|nr:hypothetical protein [Duganella sp. HH105]
MRKEYLFSSNKSSLIEAKVHLEAVLGILFSAHSSDYHGGDYFKISTMDFNVVLQENFVEDDGGTTEADFPDVPLLLYINGNPAEVDRLSALVMAAGYTFHRSNF